jgi:hypothetical protein
MANPYGTKNRTPLTVYCPDEWLPAIDEKRGDESRNAWILEAIRAKLGKGEFDPAPGPGRPRKEN